MYSHANTSQRGFTLIELLIVITILGVLSALAVFAITSLTGTSVQAACKSDFKTVEVAVEAYKAQEGVYPTLGQHNVAGTNAVAALLVKDTGTGFGPWLRDQPTNGHHYQIQATTDGTGTVEVWTWNATGQIPSTGAQDSAADCSSVTS